MTDRHGGISQQILHTAKLRCKALPLAPGQLHSLRTLLGLVQAHDEVFRGMMPLEVDVGLAQHLRCSWVTGNMEKVKRSLEDALIQ